MIAKSLPYVIIPLALLAMACQAPAGARGKAVQETVDYLLERFGRAAFREGAETLARKVEVLAVRHGDEFLKAIRQVGPRTLRLVEEAGEHANQAVRAMAQFGEHGATWIVARPKGMQMFLKYGEEAAETLVKHKGIAEPVLEKLGQPALKALQVTNVQNGRRLAMLVERGELARLGRSQELLEVIAKYGDRAMTFVWDHKGVLAGGTMLAAFLANPEPFLEGTRILAENVIRPVAEVPGQVAREVAGKANWTLLLLVIVLITAAFVAISLGYWRRLFQRRDIPLVPAGTAEEITSVERTATRNGMG